MESNIFTYGIIQKQQGNRLSLYVEDKPIIEDIKRCQILCFNPDNIKEVCFFITLESSSFKLLTINSETLKYSFSKEYGDVIDNIFPYNKTSMNSDKDYRFVFMRSTNNEYLIVDCFDNFNEIGLHGLTNKNIIITHLKNKVFIVGGGPAGSFVIDDDKIIIGQDKKIDYATKVNPNMGVSDIRIPDRTSFKDLNVYYFTCEEIGIFYNANNGKMLEVPLKEGKLTKVKHIFTFKGQVLFTLIKDKYYGAYSLDDFSLVYPHEYRRFGYCGKFFISAKNGDKTSVYSEDGNLLFERDKLNFIVDCSKMTANTTYALVYSNNSVKFMNKDFSFETEEQFYILTNTIKLLLQKASDESYSGLDPKDFFEGSNQFIFLTDRKDLSPMFLKHEDKIEVYKEKDLSKLFANLGAITDRAIQTDLQKQLKTWLRLPFLKFDDLIEIAKIVNGFAINDFSQNDPKKLVFNSILSYQVLTSKEQLSIMRAIGEKRRPSEFIPKTLARITLSTKKALKRVNIVESDLLNYTSVMSIWK